LQDRGLVALYALRRSLCSLPDCAWHIRQATIFSPDGARFLWL